MVRHLLTETLYVFLILLCQIFLLCVLRTRTDRLNMGALLAYATAVSCAILTRSEAEVYFVLTLLYVGFSYRERLLTFAKRMGLVVAVVLCLVFPWASRNYVVMGNFAVSNTILVDFNLYRGLADVKGNPSADYGFDFYQDIRSGRLPISRSAHNPMRVNILHEWLAVVKEWPRAVITERIRNLYNVMIFKGEFFFDEPMSLLERIRGRQWFRLVGKALFDGLFGVLPWCMALLGTYLALLKHQLSEAILPWIFPLGILLLMIPLWRDPRYMLPAHVLLAPLISYGIFKTRAGIVPAIPAFGRMRAVFKL